MRVSHPTRFQVLCASVQLWLLTTFPFVARAQEDGGFNQPTFSDRIGNPSTLAELIQRFIDLIRFALPLLIILTLLVFIWGLAKFILNPDSEQERSKAKTIMLWGVFMLFLMVSVWGVVALIQNTFFF